MALPDLQAPLSCLEAKDFDGATERLEHMVEALPAHLTAHVLLARTYEAKKKWDRALEAWQNARFLMPTSPIAREGTRRVLRRMDGFDEDGPRSMETAEPEPSPSAEQGAETPSEKEGRVETREPDADAEEGAGAEGTSAELEQLRRQAEREARQGGARPGLAPQKVKGTEASPGDARDEVNEPAENLDPAGGAGELDDLIDELQSARIEPDPDAPEGTEPDLEDEAEDMVSETLGRIHENQSNYKEAARIYATLAEQDPERADEFEEKAAEMRRKARSDADPDA